MADPSDRAARVEREMKTLPLRDWELPLMLGGYKGTTVEVEYVEDLVARLVDELAAQDARLIACQEKRDAYKAASIKAVDVAILLTGKLEVSEERVRVLEAALRELIERWEHYETGINDRTIGFRACAKELRAALSASPEKPA